MREEKRKTGHAPSLQLITLSVSFSVLELLNQAIIPTTQLLNYSVTQLFNYSDAMNRVSTTTQLLNCATTQLCKYPTVRQSFSAR